MFLIFYLEAAFNAKYIGTCFNCRQITFHLRNSDSSLDIAFKSDAQEAYTFHAAAILLSYISR
jgi:hypothetical protein